MLPLYAPLACLLRCRRRAGSRGNSQSLLRGVDMVGGQASASNPDSCPRHTHTTTTTHRRTSRHNTQHTHSTSRPAPPGSFRRDSSLLSSASSPRACARASSRRTVVCKRNGWAATSAIGSWKFRIIPRLRQEARPAGLGSRLDEAAVICAWRSHRRAFAWLPSSAFPAR